MLGKFLLPVALGGGLLLLLSSSAKAQAAPKNPFDTLPSNLRVLAAQAQGTNDPGMLEQVAAQLEMQGFVQAAGVLRLQAQRIREIRTSNAPAAVAAPTPVAAPIVPATVPATDSRPRPATLSPDLQQLAAEAIQNGTAPVLTSTAFVIERAGFPDVAEDLRRRARDAAAKTAPPAAKDLPSAALDPSMPSELALEVARQLQLQGDPAALEALARELRLRGFNNTAEQVEAKAKQIRAMLDAARTMNDIDREFKSPGFVPPPLGSPPQSSPPLGSPPQSPPPLFAPPTQEVPPVTITATPPGPLPVPAIPVPQAQPPERSKVQILADALASSLNTLIEQAGSMPKARFKEDQGLVRRFQAEEKLTVDGKYGPTTAQHVARYASDVPPPFYWRKGPVRKTWAPTAATSSHWRSTLTNSATPIARLGCGSARPGHPSREGTPWLTASFPLFLPSRPCLRSSRQWAASAPKSSVWTTTFSSASRPRVRTSAGGGCERKG